MNLDRDLRDALRPLSGDPVADAARVLEALPLTGPTPNGRADHARPTGRLRDRPWVPYTTLAAGLLVGALVGLLLGSRDEPDELRIAQGPRGGPGVGVGTDLVPGSSVPGGSVPGGSTAAPSGGETQPVYDPTGPGSTGQSSPTGQGVPPEPEQPDKPVPPMVGFPGVADERRELFEIMAFGELDIDEPLEGRQHLDPGRWLVRLGTQFQTGESQVGVYVFANDARMRLDRETSVRLRVDEAMLDFGRIWLDSGREDVTLRVEAGLATVILEGGSGIFTRKPSGLEVLAQRGNLIVRTEAETRRLPARERVFVDPDRGIVNQEFLSFLGTETSWMTNMIVMGSDQSELKERVQDMIAAYELGEHRNDAEREILKLGPRSVWMLADSIERNAISNHEFALRTSRLLSRVIDFPSARYGLSLLLLDDKEVRSIVFQGLRDATGTDGGGNLDFWLEASRERRRTAIENWKRQLR